MSGIAQWLVHIEFAVPAGTPPETVARIREDETRRAAELADSGTLVRLWRVPGRWANWGLWRAQDATELHAALSSLPLWEWADATVHPLAEHPNDPAAS